MDKYIPVILDGMFTIALVSVTIFSIVSNIIQRRAFEMSPTILKRYKIGIIFLPLYLLIAFIALIIFFPKDFDKIVIVWIALLLLIILITAQTYLILQPFYNLKKFKETLINEKIKKFIKENKKNSDDTYSKNIVSDLKKIQDEYKNENSYFDIKDIEVIWYKYMKIVYDKNLKISIELKKKMIEIGYGIFDERFADIFDDNHFLIEEFIEITITEKLSKFNKKLFIIVFNKLYDLYIYYKNNNSSYEKFNQLYREYLLKLIENFDYLEVMLEIIFDDKWNIKDAGYIHMYLRSIINLLNYGIINIDNIKINEYLVEKLDYIKEGFKDRTTFNKKYGEKFDVFFESCFVLINKEENNE